MLTVYRPHLLPSLTPVEWRSQTYLYYADVVFIILLNYIRFHLKDLQALQRIWQISRIISCSLWNHCLSVVERISHRNISGIHDFLWFVSTTTYIGRRRLKSNLSGTYWVSLGRPCGQIRCTCCRPTNNTSLSHLNNVREKLSNLNMVESECFRIIKL